MKKSAKNNYKNSLSLWDKQTVPGAHQDFLHFDERLNYISENITTLAELQTLSELSTELHNESFPNQGKIIKVAKILSRSETIFINNITDNLDDNEKEEAARLIAIIILNNPYLARISLDNNNFSTDELPLIINAMVKAKENPLLQTRLTEVHLRNSISAESTEEIIPKLILLTQKYDMTLILDPNVSHLLSLKQIELKNLNYHKACESYLNFLADKFILPVIPANSKKDVKMTRAMLDKIIADSLQDDKKLDAKFETAVLKYQRVRDMQKILESAQDPFAKKEAFDKHFEQNKELLLTNIDHRDKNQELNLIKRMANLKNVVSGFFANCASEKTIEEQPALAVRAKKSN